MTGVDAGDDAKAREEVVVIEEGIHGQGDGLAG